MWTRHVSRQIAPLVDGELAASEAQRVEAHLSGCELCAAERDQITFAMTALERLPVVEAPPEIWISIEAALRDGGARAPGLRWWRTASVAMALAALVLVIWIFRAPETQWRVVSLNGAPAVGSRPLQGTGLIGAGQWIETDSASRAAVTIGEIGSVEVGPNSRVRVVAMRPGEHRLSLARGEIRATISAPPKLFFVDTPSVTAIDLGCEYSLHTDEAGVALLSVTKGWVSLEWEGKESLVPAGASCRARPHAAPGIPYFDDATQKLKDALDRFAFEKPAAGALDVILDEARVRDTLTLWHLLPLVDGADRTRVFQRMAMLTPVPAGVTLDKVLRLDPATLILWKEELAWTW